MSNCRGSEHPASSQHRVGLKPGAPSGPIDASVEWLEAGLTQFMDALRSYYNGYEFGTIAMYNPWSILEFLASETKEFMPYWVNTSENRLIKDLLQRHAFAVEKEIQALLEG